MNCLMHILLIIKAQVVCTKSKRDKKHIKKQNSSKFNQKGIK